MNVSMIRPTFPSIDDFYLARGGAFSGEHDLGVWWKSGEDDGHGHGAENPIWALNVWRISWVETTGDLYAIAARPTPLPVLLLAENVTRADLDRLTESECRDGCDWHREWSAGCGCEGEWWYRVGTPGSLYWAIQRTAEFAPKEAT